MGAPALGGAGCGVATLISIILSLITFMGYIRAVPMLYRTTLRFNTQPLRAGEIRSFYRLSLPLGLAASVECSCFTLIALLLSPLGPEQVSAHSIAMSATSCLYNLPLSMGIAASIAVGYNIGSGNLQMLRAVIQAGYRLAFAGTASLIYRKMHVKRGAELGLVAGVICMTLVMVLWNYLLTPIYLGTDRAAVASLLVPAIIPFNLIKGIINSLIIFVLYKPLVNALRRSGFAPASHTLG